MISKIEHEFDYGQIVYLKTDPAQYERIITQIRVMGNKEIRYGVSFQTSEYIHAEVELSAEKDELKTLRH